MLRLRQIRLRMWVPVIFNFLQTMPSGFSCELVLPVEEPRLDSWARALIVLSVRQKQIREKRNRMHYPFEKPLNQAVRVVILRVTPCGCQQVYDAKRLYIKRADKQVVNWR